MAKFEACTEAVRLAEAEMGTFRKAIKVDLDAFDNPKSEATPAKPQVAVPSRLAEPTAWAFDYQHPSGEWVSVASTERPKEGPHRRNIRPLYEHKEPSDA